MKNDWTDILKKQLEGHEMTPPTGLWEGIDKQMGVAFPSTEHRKSIAWWKLSAVAAIALLAIGFFTLYDFNQSIPQELLSEKQEISDISETSNEEINEAITSTLQTTKKKQVPALAHLQADSIITIVDTLTYVDVYVEDSQSDAKDEEKDMPVIEKNEPTHRNKTQGLVAEMKKGNANKRELTLSLNASNAIFIHSNREEILSEDSWFPSSKPQESDKRDKHHAPMRIGLKLSYPISDRLSLLSGISYTFLKSEFADGHYIHRHHYIGIPMGLQYGIWNNEHLFFYGSAGVLIEKCFKSTHENLYYSFVRSNKDKPWQLSVNASLGAEYRLNRSIGIYLEPSIGYYFDDGTFLYHYYKEHPLAPSLEIGLRWNM